MNKSLELKTAQLCKALGRIYAREQRKGWADRDYMLMIGIECALNHIDAMGVDIPAMTHVMRGFHSILPYVR